MTNYARLYRFGITPWERYRTAASASIAALLDREEAERSRPLGRALDVGCFQGLDAGQREPEGEGISSLANPGAIVLLLSFGPSRWRWLVEGASQAEVQAAFAGWEMLTVDPADTAGLGWPMNKTAPQWYRMRLQA